MTNKTIGKYGENLAKEFLIKKGYKILELNYHYSKVAEVDIIAKKDNTIHFVEVKTRTQRLFGAPMEAINAKKIKSIYSCAQFYINNSKNHFEKMQIDAIAIILDKNKEPQIDFLENISLN